MSNEVTKIKMRSANNRPQKMNLEFVHAGTSDFFKPQIIHCQAVNPGETVNIQTIVNFKGKPMMMPGEIQIKHHLAAFWVPNFATHQDWFAFRTNLPFKHDNGYGKNENDYYLYNKDLIQIFFYANNSVRYIDYNHWTWLANTGVIVETMATKYDICCTMWEHSGTNTNTFKGTLCFNLTNQGRQLLNLLQQLGYEINWQVAVNAQAQLDWTSSSTILQQLMAGDSSAGYGGLAQDLDGFDPATDLIISARPILSFMKIMIDYYVPPQYENNYDKTFKEILERSTYINVWPDLLVPNIGALIIDLASWVNYNIDRFTGAWKNPEGPNDSNILATKQIIDTTAGSLVNRPAVGQTADGTAYIGKEGSTVPTTSGTYGITNYILRVLDAVQNFTTRNRIAGYRPIDRFLAHFGKRLDYIHTKRCQYLDGNTNNLSVIDVTAMAENANQIIPSPTGVRDSGLLGGQAAKVSGTNQLSVNWTADDDGWIFIIDTIIPRSGYFQGIKNHCLRVNWRDLYNSEFDNLGTQPIRRAELFHSSEGLATILNTEQIWGWEPTYMGQKTGWDTKSGDRRIRTLNEGLDAMDTFRTFNVRGSNLPQSNGSSFIRGEQAQYDRIFQYMFGDVDHFYFTALTRDTGNKPMKSVSESLPLTDGEGNVTEWQYGGGNYMQ